jgi:hypothetical protein
VKSKRRPRKSSISQATAPTWNALQNACVAVAASGWARRRPSSATAPASGEMGQPGQRAPGDPAGQAGRCAAPSGRQRHACPQHQQEAGQSEQHEQRVGQRQRRIVAAHTGTRAGAGQQAQRDQRRRQPARRAVQPVDRGVDIRAEVERPGADHQAGRRIAGRARGPGRGRIVRRRAVGGFLQAPHGLCQQPVADGQLALPLGFVHGADHTPATPLTNVNV